jgi:hypothetical protein
MPSVNPLDADEKLDYVEITDDQKVAIKECVKILREMNLSTAANEILMRTGLEVIPEYPLEDSEFISLMKENNIFCGIQGYIQDEGMRYPIVSVISDVRKMDEAFLTYKHKSKRKFW